MNAGARIGFLSLLLCGAGCLVAGGVMTQRTLSLLDGTRTDGTIVRYEVVSTDNGRSHYPVVEFEARDGSSHTFESEVGGNPKSDPVGSDVDVLYDPSDPGGAILDTWTDKWLLPTVLAPIGAILLALGMWLPRRLGFGPVLGRTRGPEWWRANGVALSGTLVEIRPNTRVRANGRSPVRAHVEATDPATGVTRVFMSGNLWDGVPQGRAVGSAVTVYVAPGNGRGSFVDL